MGQHHGRRRFEMENKHLKRQTHFCSSLFVALTQTPSSSEAEQTPLQPLFLSCSQPPSAFCPLLGPRCLWAGHEPKMCFSRAENRLMGTMLPTGTQESSVSCSNFCILEKIRTPHTQNRGKKQQSLLTIPLSSALPSTRSDTAQTSCPPTFVESIVLHAALCSSFYTSTAASLLVQPLAGHQIRKQSF